MTEQPLVSPFTEEESEQAHAAWRFNCGPGALCGLLQMTPEQIRPHMLDFESKGYTNPTLMFGVLDKLGLTYRKSYRSDAPNFRDCPCWHWPKFGLVRIQWGGPWTKPDVPMRVRYRLTHWIAHRIREAGAMKIFETFDVNTAKYGWIPTPGWEKSVAPWLIQGYPKADGTWWPTHAIEVTGKQ